MLPWVTVDKTYEIETAVGEFGYWSIAPGQEKFSARGSYMLPCAGDPYPAYMLIKKTRLQKPVACTIVRDGNDSK